MTKKNELEYEDVSTRPVKSFFATMLTRDIKLEDAILDLLDNCIDGIARSKKGLGGKRPYEGYWAEIEFKRDSFTISDNCGGIPWKLHGYAFRMGKAHDRPSDTKGTVGTYGIGMKRAVFKMGKNCLISTQNRDSRYEVHIKPEWIEEEEEWMLPVKASKKGKDEDGTTIYIRDLYPGVSSRFDDDAAAFKADLDKLIATHYAFIINKGFQVKINGTAVKPRPTRLAFSKSAKGIKPYIFEASIDGVDIFLTVGFTRPIPSQEEASDEQTETKYSTQNAGWTVLCNDRAVLFADKTELTGWGEAGVPQYHTQFIAISGVVEFRAADASKLPTTTTKRGIDTSSKLYLRVKNKMREGMKRFTDYTNRWKSYAEESKKYIEDGTPLSLEEIKSETRNISFNKTKHTLLPGKQYSPDLPVPKKEEPNLRRISFTKERKHIERVAEYLFDDRDAKPSDVGEKCFDLILKEAKK
jgi:hypothetical protein